MKTLEEARRVTAKYQVEQTVLRADALEVNARLAKAQYDLSVAENGVATQREHLNQLLGRDLATVFRVDLMPETAAEDLPLQVARERAQRSRPEIKQAQLKQKQAEYDRRIAKAEYIPDLSVSVRYLGMNNVSFVPGNIGVAGFFSAGSHSIGGVATIRSPKRRRPSNRRGMASRKPSRRSQSKSE